MEFWHFMCMETFNAHSWKIILQITQKCPGHCGICEGRRVLMENQMRAEGQERGNHRFFRRRLEDPSESIAWWENRVWRKTGTKMRWCGGWLCRKSVNHWAIDVCLWLYWMIVFISQHFPTFNQSQTIRTALHNSTLNRTLLFVQPLSSSRLCVNQLAVDHGTSLFTFPRSEPADNW